MVLLGCGVSSDNMNDNQNEPPEEFLISSIDLNNWKVTLPITNPNEIEPPEILDYASIDVLHKYMYNDSLDGSIVFYVEPGSTTPNSSYSRTELREQMVPGSNNTNWTFEEGGTLEGRLKVSDVSGELGDKDRIIVMQIHGRLTDEQKELIQQDDNNAPPILKIYWDDGKINVRRKVLENINVSEVDLLHKEAWVDESNWFASTVGNGTFDLKVIASKTSLSVELNEEEILMFDDIHIEKWGVFENYFKAGNYLQSTEDNAFSKVKYYELKVKH